MYPFRLDRRLPLGLEDLLPAHLLASSSCSSGWRRAAAPILTWALVARGSLPSVALLLLLLALVAAEHCWVVALVASPHRWVLQLAAGLHVVRLLDVHRQPQSRQHASRLAHELVFEGARRQPPPRLLLFDQHLDEGQHQLASRFHVPIDRLPLLAVPFPLLTQSASPQIAHDTTLCVRLCSLPLSSLLGILGNPQTGRESRCPLS